MKTRILNHAGEPVEIDISETIYREAHENNCTVGQLLERKFGAETNTEQYGSVLEQIAACEGLLVRGDKRLGLRAATFDEVVNGKASMNAGVIVRDGAPASRIIFPAVILEMVENGLKKDYATQAPIFDGMVAIDDTIAGNRFEQPVVNYSNPEGARSKAISQLALPETMLTLTVSDTARKIPTFSIGMEISDEAAKATTLDFVTLSLQRQVAAERDARVEGYITALVGGDADMGQAALSVATAASYDSAASTGITQKAWVKFLFHNFRKRQITHVICDIDSALAIEGRANKPVITGDDPNSPRIDATFQLLNNKLSQVKMFVVDSGILAAKNIAALDARYAIRRVRNSEAQYQAAEQFVLRKSSALRFDFGEIVYRLYDDAWDVMSYA